MLNADPVLGLLQNNGGLTPTQALGNGSAAFGTGTVPGSPPIFDQRGPNFYRVVNNATDIGAYQTQTPPSITPPADQSAVEGNSKSIQLGSFSGYPGASSYTATIDWGDGSSPTAFSVSPGTIPMQNHTYGEEGAYTVTVTVTDNQNDKPLTDSFGVTVSDPSVSASNFSIGPVAQGTPTGSIPLATFTDPGGAEPNQYTPGVTKLSAVYQATVDWGDGTSLNPDTQQATISFQPGSYAPAGTFTVTGPSHIYYAPGEYDITVTINHESSAPTVVHDSIEVLERDEISVTGTNLSGNPGQPLNNVTVGSFTDTYPFTLTGAKTTASSYIADIDWGDGSSMFVPVTIVPNGSGGYNLTGTHTYTSSGVYETTLLVEKKGQPSDYSFGGGEVTIAPSSLSATSVTGTATEGSAYTGPVASITSNDYNLQSSDFSAVIAWSNGTVQPATISGGNGQFTVSGSFTFADEGTYPVRVKLTEPDLEGGTQQIALTSTVKVQDADVFTPHSKSLTATSGTVWSGVVATFTDSYTGNTPNDFNATINWGDGAITHGVVGFNGTDYTVSGSHTYSKAGTFRAAVTLNDDSPGTATSTAISQFSVSSTAPKIVTNNSGPVVVIPLDTTNGKKKQS